MAWAKGLGCPRSRWLDPPPPPHTKHSLFSVLFWEEAEEISYAHIHVALHETNTVRVVTDDYVPPGCQQEGKRQGRAAHAWRGTGLPRGEYPLRTGGAEGGSPPSSGHMLLSRGLATCPPRSRPPLVSEAEAASEGKERRLVVSPPPAGHVPSGASVQVLVCRGTVTGFTAQGCGEKPTDTGAVQRRVSYKQGSRPCPRRQR